MLKALPRWWRMKRRARRKAVLSTLRFAPIFVLLVGLGVWAISERAPSQIHRSDITCAYPQQNQQGAKRNSGPLLTCKQTDSGPPEYDAYRQAKQGNPQAFLPAARHWLADTTGNPVSLFTLVLAISTIGLWFSTRGLMRGGERQNAWAARQTEIIFQQKELSRLQFFAAHRPQITVHAVEFISVPSGDGDGRNTIGASILCFNTGTGSVNVAEARGDILVTRAISVDVQRRLVATFEDVEIGVKMRFSIVSDRTLNDLPGGTAVYCVGTIAYSDATDARRETGFCFVLQGRMGARPHWTSAESPEHEYSY